MKLRLVMENRTLALEKNGTKPWVLQSHFRGRVLVFRDSFRVVLRELPDSLRLEDQRVLYLEVCVEFLGNEVGDATS